MRGSKSSVNSGCSGRKDFLKSGTSTTFFSSLRVIGTVTSRNAKGSWGRILIWSQPETRYSEELRFIHMGAARLVSRIPVAGRIGENVRGRQTHPL